MLHAQELLWMEQKKPEFAVDHNTNPSKRRWHRHLWVQFISAEQSNKHSGRTTRPLIHYWRSRASLCTSCIRRFGCFAGCKCPKNKSTTRLRPRRNLKVLTGATQVKRAAGGHVGSWGGTDERRQGSCHSCSTHGHFMEHLQAFGLISGAVLAISPYGGTLPTSSYNKNLNA